MDDVSTTDAQKETTENASDFRLGKSFWLVTFASLVAFTSISAVIIGRPLLMDELGFDATAISGVLVAGGLVSLPLTFFIGWLSDLFGRKNLLLMCYLIATIGVGILVFSEPLWSFWLSEIFLTFVGISVVVGSALVTDIVPKEALDTAISRFTASAWIGTIIGFAIAGYVIDWVGINKMFAMAAIPMFIALIIIVPIQQSKVK